MKQKLDILIDIQGRLEGLDETLKGLEKLQSQASSTQVELEKALKPSWETGDPASWLSQSLQDSLEISSHLSFQLSGQLRPNIEKITEAFGQAIFQGKDFGKALRVILDELIGKIIDLTSRTFSYSQLLGGLSASAPSPAESLLGGLLQKGISLLGFAEGGLVSGAGSARSDSILAKLSNGEFVMPAAQTSRNLPALESLRRGEEPLARSANGGVVVQQHITVESGVPTHRRAFFETVLPEIIEAAKAAVEDERQRRPAGEV